MLWENYQTEFVREALALDKDTRFIESCLTYAKKLHDAGLAIIFDQNHFCKLVGYNDSYIYAASNAQENFYTKLLLPKKSRGVRTIFAPYPSLKDIQRWILDNILCNIKVSKYAKAYICGRSIIDNAKFHKNQETVVNIDVKDFFPSIKYKCVYKIFINYGYSRPVSTLLANLCTLNGELPQGAPTSPAISNIICDNIDRRISGFATKNKIRYTRYADDITLSGNFNVKSSISIVRKILNENGFKMNKDKINVMRKNNRQSVTGIIVNEKLNISKSLKRELRKQAYYIDKFGIEPHLTRIAPFDGHYIEKLLGQAYFARFINYGNGDLDRIINIFKKAYQASNSLIKTFGKQ